MKRYAKTKTFFTKILLVISSLLSFVNSANSQERGNYFIKNFDPKETGVVAQTWTGVEDNNGVMYFATGTRISTYDGKNWSSIKLNNDAPPLSFCKNEDGVIYVGAVGEIGYLEPAQDGRMIYKSLKKLIPKKHNDFQNVWTCVSHNGYVYFSTDQGIFSWNGKEISFINLPVFFTLNKIGDQVYFSTKNEGLYELNKGVAKPAKNGGHFKNTAIVGGVSLNKEDAIFLSGKDAVIIYNKKTGEINSNKYGFGAYNEELINGMIYTIEKSVNNKILIGTINKGLYIFDSKGNLLNQLTVEQGLLNNAINKVFNDRMGNAWLCTDKGVARIEINVGIKNWSLNEGVEGAVEDIIVVNNTTYIGSSTAVKYLNNGKFVPVEGIQTETWKLHLHNNQLYVGNTQGLFEINTTTNKASLIAKFSTVWSIETDGSKLILGTSEGLFEFDPKTKQTKKIHATTSPVRSIGIDNRKNIWYATDNKGVGYVSKEGKHVQFDKSNGLLNTTNNQIFKVKNQLYVATKDGLLKPNDNCKKLIRACDLGDFMCKAKTGIWRLKDNGKNLLFSSTYGEASARFSIINLKNKQRDTLNLKRLPKMHIYSFYDNNNVLWMATPYGVFQYNKSEVKNLKYNNKTLVRRIIIGKDSILFDGNYSGKKINSITSLANAQSADLIPKIDYAFNEMNFIFSSPFYCEEGNTMYQYKLEGFDDEWSEWSIDNFKNYTNLFEGKYTFQVRAKNIYGQISEIGSYKFTIRPPWFRTYIAYFIYVLILVGFVYLIIRMYTKKLREDNIKLEKIVDERTAEVVKQRDEIQEKNEMITESIEYAKTIQEAIITSDDYFRAIFSDLFILFKPKDIVSGDFYWGYKTKSNKLFWAAADCTGHGVPGAFMTMIGMSLLNEIVIEKEIEDTNLILDLLRDSIIKTLNKNIDLDSDEKMRNGMDIALCCWDLNTNEVSFSGANNPMYVLRNGELIEFKADKQPIGIYKKMTPYTKNTIQVQKGDKIYTFSDGYADQMNEEESRFKIVNLKKAILEIGDKPTSSQREFFDTTYENWRGNYEQMDDVVLIGVEI